MQNKNILIISDRSRYFSFLGSRLEKAYKVFYAAVRQTDESILSQAGKEFISLGQLLSNPDSNASESPLSLAEAEKALYFELERDKLYNRGVGRDLIIKRGIKLSIETAKIIKANKVDLVIVQNDSQGYTAVPLAVCKKKNAKTLIFEDGFFRPDTVILDCKGVNFNNSCPRDRDFYEHIVIEREKFDNFLDTEKSKIFKPAATSLFPLRYILGAVKQPGRIPLIYPELKLYFQEGSYRQDKIGNYALLALQVRTDSQILCHSPVKDTKEVVRLCVAAIKKYNQRAKTPLALVIKEHPKDECFAEVRNLISRAGLKVVFLRRADTRSLIKASTMVITVNSTVGLEGLLFYKPVITLGRAFYNIDGIVLHDDNPDNLDMLIEKAVNTPVEKELIDKFLYYLKFHYQADGNLDCPDEKNIAPVAKRIKNILEGSVCEV